MIMLSEPPKSTKMPIFYSVLFFMPCIELTFPLRGKLSLYGCCGLKKNLIVLFRTLPKEANDLSG